MGRAYAGALGYLAATLTLARGVIAGAGLEGTLLAAMAAMAVFVPIGLVLGVIAQSTIDHAVRDRLESQLAASRTSAAP